ncbi:hypothetical protein JTB14_026582 [Gonioctena quinquepunctata]|nr:hypothetical protein JTB14_026582 [Gonioctena quinquepunctata]
MARNRKENSSKKGKVEKTRKFKSDLRSATAIVSAIDFLQKTGFTANLRNIKSCITQRCRKPASTIVNNLPTYLSRGTDLGIFKKHGGVYKLGNFELKKKKKKSVKASVTTNKHKSEDRMMGDVIEDVIEEKSDPTTPQPSKRNSCCEICCE